MDAQEFFRKYHAGEELTTDDCVEVIVGIFDDIDKTLEQIEEREAQMGAFDRAKDILVPNDEKPEEAAAFRKKWGWEPHEQVTLRGRMTAGIQEEVTNASSGISKDNAPLILAGSGRNVLLEHMIVRWTLTRNGQPVEVSLDAIRQLPAEYSTPLLEICDRMNAGVMTEEQQKAFLPSANGHTPESLHAVK